jgi:hypothetical protein
VEHLAESLSYKPLYLSVYRATSSGVHAADAGRFVNVDDDAESGVAFSVSSNTDGIATTLGFASLRMTDMLILADGRLGLGIKERAIRLHERA